jgi:O-methyltransferase
MQDCLSKPAPFGISEEGKDAIYASVKEYTLTSIERVRSLIDSVEYIVRNRVPGSIVECGVWRGGSIMASARALLELGDTERDFYLYDTFTGMTHPDAIDIDLNGEMASRILEDHRQRGAGWCVATLDEVRANFLKTGYNSGRLHFVAGPVEETLNDTVPDQIALLRLDTDWYKSTLVELEVLYPRLVPDGVLIVDDYGHWRGARAACDEFFSSLAFEPLLQRIDYTGRLVVKPRPPTGR